MILYGALSQSTNVIKFKSIGFYGRQFNPENPDVRGVGGKFSVALGGKVIWLCDDCLGFEAKSTDNVLYSIDPNMDILAVNYFDSRPKTVEGNRLSYALFWPATNPIPNDTNSAFLFRDNFFGTSMITIRADGATFEHGAMILPPKYLEYGVFSWVFGL